MWLWVTRKRTRDETVAGHFTRHSNRRAYRRLSYLLIKCLFVAICRKIFKLWFLRYKRKIIHRHLCRALAKKVRSLFKIVGYIYSYLSLKPTLLEATLSVCLREVSACCLRIWRDFNHANREFEIPRRRRPARKVKRPLKSEFAFFQSLYRLLQLICLLKCKRTLFEPNS